MDHTDTEVLIVGAGPTGLMAALLLARWGVRSVVVDQKPGPDPHPRAHEVNARSMEILRDAGVDEAELMAEASPLEDASRVIFGRTINEEIGRIDLLADPERRAKYERHLRQRVPYLNLSQSVLERILVAHAEASPHVELRFGCRWRHLEMDVAAVHSEVEGASPEKVRSRWLLACDGASSPVRKSLGVVMDGPAAIQTFVNAYFELDLRSRVPEAAKLYWILHPDHAGVFVAHHRARRWVYAMPVYTPWEQPDAMTEAVLSERIERALGFRAPDLRIASTSVWHMTAQVARQYRGGRVLLLGDAAHRFPPTGGLGMNTGIADAHNLCWKLALVLRHHADEALLDTYEAERRPVALHNCAESLHNYEKLSEVIRALGLHPRGLEWIARAQGTPPLRRLPASVRQGVRRCITAPARWQVGRALRQGRVRARVQEAISRQVDHFDRLGLDIGHVYGGPNVARVSEYLPSTAPGARLPHEWDGAKTQSTHDLLDYTRFTVLYRGACAIPAETPILCAQDTSPFSVERFPPEAGLLVRPDGHVAAHLNHVENAPATLAHILAGEPRPDDQSSPQPEGVLPCNAAAAS